MIFTDRKITICNGKSTINEPVILYRGDYEVSIRFTIMESKFRFKSGVNLVDSEKASHGQLAILTPYGGNVFSEIVKCEDGTVTFTLTKEMIDQLEEVGLYSFQIRLFDYYRESRVSIPPVEFGIEVREPVASEDHDNEVNNAVVGYSIAKVVDGLNEDVPDTFDDNGQYNKTDWETGDRISEGRLNKIEDALDKINQNEKNDVANLDKRITSNYNILDITKASTSAVTDIQNQVDNLVLGAVGDGNNPEVVQARGVFDTLNSRLSVNERMFDDVLEPVLPMEISSILEIEDNLWQYGEVKISYVKGATWRYSDHVLYGLDIDESYTLIVSSIQNHSNSDYVVELLNCDIKHVQQTNGKIMTKFKPHDSSITIRFQAAASTPTTEANTAVYSGISIRKGDITVKNEAIQKQYKMTDIVGIDEVFDIPHVLMNHETFSDRGGDIAYDAVRKDYYNVIPGTEYTIEYEAIIGSKLNNEAVVIYTCFDSNGQSISGNVPLLYGLGPKRGSFTMPEGTNRLQVHFMISNATALGEHDVTWTGVSIFGGASQTGISLKESAIPKNLTSNMQIDVSQVRGMDQFINNPHYLWRNSTVADNGGLSQWKNKAFNIYDIKPNTIYSLRYENVENSRLSDGEPLVVYTCHDASNNMIKNNTNVVLQGGPNTGTFIAPEGTAYIRLMFIITLGTIFSSEEAVIWTGVDIVEGEKFEASLNLENADIPVSEARFDLHLPKDIYVAIGYPLEIYNHTICRCINIDNYIFEWSLPKGGGKTFANKLLITPGDDLNNTTDTLTLKVYDLNFKMVATQSATVHYKKPTSALAPANPKKILCIGDSLTDLSTWREQLYNRFKNEVATNKIEYLGTLGKSPYFNEGHSGWALRSFLTDASEGWNGNYKILVSSAPSISPKKQYYFGNKVFEYEKTENANGQIWVYFNRISGGGFVSTADSPCRGVDSAVSGDASIPFTAAEITSFNPFYNNGTFDSAYYSATYLGGVKPDIVFIWLGTNGSMCTMDIESAKTKVSSEMLKYKTIVDNIKTNWTNAKIFISYLHYRPDQNGQGNTNGTSNAKGWDNYIFEFNNQLFGTFADYDNVIFIPVGQTFDRVNNYPNTTIPVNTRNTVTMSVARDTVHMAADTGFLQVADAIYGAFINNL